MRRLLLAAAMLGTVSAAQAADMPDLPILRGTFTDGLTNSRQLGGRLCRRPGRLRRRELHVRPALMAALLARQRRSSRNCVSQWNRPLARLPTAAPPATARSPATMPSGTMSCSAWKRATSTASSSAEFGLGQLKRRCDHCPTARAQVTAMLDVFDRHQVWHIARPGRLCRGDASCPTFSPARARNADITDRRSQDASSTSGRRSAGRPISTDVQHNHLIYGYSAGLGVDINLVGGLFMRAEWEYHPLRSPKWTPTSTPSAPGLGYKF